MREFLNKKLLILGATTETIPLVKKAKELGCISYVVDPYSNAPAKRYASHPIDLDCYDIERISQLIKDEKIDGILPGCADILVPVYEEICRLENKYCYVNEDLINAFNNKKGLKELLKKYNLPVIEEYSYEEVTNGIFNDYPIFVKPVDNNSSKGMSVVYDNKSFKIAHDKALSFSKSKSILIEKYKETDDFFIGYFLQDGNIINTFTADRYVIRQAGYATITSGIMYPSKHSDLYFKTTHSKVIDMFNELNFKNGIIAIQGFVEDNKIMFYDPALRITGGQEYIFSKLLYDVDILECLIRFALTGKMSKNEKEYIKCDYKFNNKYACNLTFSVRPGKINKIVGINYLLNHPNVINVTQEHMEGDLIDKIGTAQQNVFRIHIVADDIDKLKNVIVDLQRELIIYDDNNQSMMLDGLNPIEWYEERKTNYEINGCND